MHVSPALEYIYACLRAAGSPSGCFIVTGITDCARSGCTILHPTGDEGPAPHSPASFPATLPGPCHLQPCQLWPLVSSTSSALSGTLQK